MALSIHQILSQATTALTTNGVPNPRLDAEVLLAHALELTRAGLYTRLQDVIPEADVQWFHQLLYRRQQREPLQYITGVQEFWSLEFRVTPDVLIPRPETEFVVETALRLLAQHATRNTQYRGNHREESQKSKVENLTLDPGPWTLDSRPLASGPWPPAPKIFDLGTGSGCIAVALAKELPDAELWAIDISSAALAIAQENARRHGVAEQ